MTTSGHTTQAAPDLAQSTQLAFARAAQGDLPIVDLFNAANTLTAAGHADIAAQLYRLWLAHTVSAVAYAGWHNLGVLLENGGDQDGAEAAYRAALAQKPDFAEARRNLGELFERNRRRRAALRAGRGFEPDAGPLVSILIPTHNRPDYFEQALKSALSQTYDHIEIIVSDNSDDEATRARLAPYLAQYDCIVYSRVPGYPVLDNFQNCYTLARGDYVNYLMDDDLFHPDKIERMMECMLARPNVGLVTSVRQLIDEHGNHMSAVPPFERVFEVATLIDGRSLGNSILTKEGSIVGEPTTTLFRKSDLGERFGMFRGRQQLVMIDMASWLAILSHKDAVYLPEPLSYFRVHGGQDQRRRVTQIRASIEGLEMFCDAYEDGRLLPRDDATHALLTQHLTNFLARMLALHEDIKTGAFDVERIHGAIRQATAILLAR